MSDYVKSTQNEVKAQSRYALDTAKDAVHSAGYLYALKGIVHFASNKSCWGPFAKALPPALALSVGVVGFMFTFTYLPQAAVLSVVNFGPIGASLLKTALGAAQIHRAFF